jgi:hypothetical protein
MLIPWQSHHGVEAFVPGLSAMSSSDGMDLVLEYILSDPRGFLWLRPFIPSA